MGRGQWSSSAVSGRCLHATASLREPTKDIWDLLKIHKNLIIKGSVTKLVTMRIFLHAKIHRILTEWLKFHHSFIVFICFTAQNPTSDKWLPLHSALILWGFFVFPLCYIVCHHWQVLPQQNSSGSGWRDNATATLPCTGSTSFHPLCWALPHQASCQQDVLWQTCQLKAWEGPKKAETAMQPLNHNLKIPVKASCTGSWCHCWC